MADVADASSRPLTLGFAGTPGFAAAILAGLVACGRTPVVVYTQPDRPTGRGRRPQPTEVKRLALDLGIPVQQPATLRHPDAPATLAGFRLDVLVVAAYGLLLPRTILDVPSLGCINVHASLLPRWRGAAPIERAILAGDTVTGVSIMQMDRGLDTGPVYLTRSCPIGPTTTGPELEARLAGLGNEALAACLDQLPGLQPAAQPETGACYAHKLTLDDARIDWSNPAALIDRQVRALCGRMPAFTFLGQVRLQVLEALPVEPRGAPGPAGTIVAADPRGGIVVACGEGALAIRRLQLNRGKGTPLAAADALNGYPDLFRSGRCHASPE